MAKINERLIERPLGQNSISARVDMARVYAYSVFSEEKSSQDFYFENFINSFIALVQYPVSFVVIKDSKVLFHFCHDNEHYQWFSDGAEREKDWGESNSFALCPDVLGGNYRVAIYLMNTKRFSLKKKAIIIRRRSIEKPCQDYMHYIASCAQRYFEETWYGFCTMFSGQAREAIKNSLDKLEKTYKKGSDRIWPALAQENFDLQEEREINIPNTNPDAWVTKIDGILTNVINNSRYGLRVFTGLSHVRSGGSVVESYWKEVQPPNILVAYRSYTRRRNYSDIVQPRYITQEGCEHRYSGYAHNVNFVVPTNTEDSDEKLVTDDPYSAYFRFLQRHFSKDWKVSYEKEGTGRQLYSNLFEFLVEDPKKTTKAWRKKVQDFKSLAVTADEEFWAILGDHKKGIQKIQSIMRSKVGDFARSIADPVFSTGIIHINPGFELGGLDRIQESHTAGITNFQDLEDLVKIDVLRIVAAYYYMSGSAAWAGEMPRAKDPRKLNIMLLPIKMRGAVWGVSAHAFYLENYEKQFQYNTVWLSNFLLATAGRQKLQSRFDSILWEAVQQRILRLIIKYIGSARTSEEFFSAIDIINQKIRGEQLLSPYALPQFSIVAANDTSIGEENGLWYVGQRLKTEPGEKETFFRLQWVIEENDFFSARQPWTKKGTRNFLNIVDLGLKRALERWES